MLTTDPRLTVMEAIARKRIIMARYNGNEAKLAPHLLFARRGDLFVSALNMNKKFRSLEERQLGHFKLDGLSATELTAETFDPLPSYEAAPPNDEDELLLAI